MVEARIIDHLSRGILQVNVRLSEGGAAGVARTLSDGLSAIGVPNRFVYGYGRRGRDSPIHSKYDAIRLTPSAVALANMSAFRLIGDDTTLKSKARWRQLEAAIAESDVVHLHAIHSYMGRAEEMVNAIVRLNRPVVWTMHDQWLFTGRCAQPHSCRLYKSGCQSCPDLSAYPPALVDNAARVFPQRRSLVDRLAQSVPFQLVSCAEWLAVAAVDAGLPEPVVIRNSTDEVFWSASAAQDRNDDGRCKVLFVCRDLRDERKVNWDVLRQVSEIDGAQLTIVGDNAEQNISKARILPSSSDRAHLAQLMTAHDVLLFTSEVDYFPLTIVEALVAGLRVLAIDSTAARELSESPAVQLVSVIDDIVPALRNIASRNGAAVHAVNTHRSREAFAPLRMVTDYLDIYDRLATENVGSRS